MNTTTVNVSIGADVMGTSGNKLGTVSGAIVDARTDKVTDLLVKHGTLLARERVVPIVHVTRVEDGTVYLDLDEKGFETMDGYSEERRGPNPDYVGPPDADLQGVRRGNFVFDTVWAQGAAAGMGIAGKPMGFPGGEQVEPQDMTQRPAIHKGMAIHAADGEKVGELGEFSIAVDTGQLTRLTLQRGLLFKHEVEIPLEWVRDVGSDGVLLNVPKSQVEELAASRQGKDT